MDNKKFVKLCTKDIKSYTEYCAWSRDSRRSRHLTNQQYNIMLAYWLDHRTVAEVKKMHENHLNFLYRSMDNGDTKPEQIEKEKEQQAAELAEFSSRKNDGYPDDETPGR